MKLIICCLAIACWMSFGTLSSTSFVIRTAQTQTTHTITKNSNEVTSATTTSSPTVFSRDDNKNKGVDDSQAFRLFAATGGGDTDEDVVKLARMVTGEELELMLTEWDTPLVIDAYATWCGPCLLMSPEFEAAAKELEGKVRFVKIDTDQEEEMATRLAINGLPTLLFLDKYVPPDSDSPEEDAKAVLKGRIEGAMQKENIIDFCNHYFFDGPEPKL